MGFVEGQFEPNRLVIQKKCDPGLNKADVDRAAAAMLDAPSFGDAALTVAATRVVRTLDVRLAAFERLRADASALLAMLEAEQQ